MSARIHKVHRLLDLIALLTSRHYPLTRGQIWDEVEGYRARLAEGANEDAVRRTFERDKKELVDLGFPLRIIEDPLADPGDQQRYHLSHRDFYLPYLRLVRRDEELQSRPRKWVTPRAPIAPEQVWMAAEALDALRHNPELPRSAAAESAFRKLTFDLAHPEAEFAPVEVILTSDDAAARERVETLSDAVRERRVLRFEYHSMGRDAVAMRQVEPWALLFKLNRWYMIGHDLDREARRVFRISRMSSVELLDPAGAFQMPDVDLSAWKDADAWNLPGDESPAFTVDVRFAFPRSLWADRNQFGEEVSVNEDGSAVRRVEVRSVDPFLRRLLGFGAEVSVESPPEIHAALRAMRARVASIYREHTGGAGEGGEA